MPGPNYQFHLITIATLRYSYVCEHCGEPSGPQPYIVERSEHGIMNAYDAEPERVSIEYTMRKNMPNHLARLTRMLKRGRCPFNAKCPHCGAFQSWGLQQVLRDAAMRVLPFDLFALLIAVWLWMKGRASVPALIAGLAVCVLMSAIYLFPYWRAWRRAGKTPMPEADWSNIELSTTMRRG